VSDGKRLEARLRSMLADRAASVTGLPDEAGLAAKVTTARKRRHQRRLVAGTLSVVMALAVGVGLEATVVGSHQASVAQHRNVRQNGILVLPLSGTVRLLSPERFGGATLGLPKRGEKNIAATGAAGAVPVGPIDVAPSAAPALQRLFAHTSPDGVQITAFDQPGAGSGSSPAQVSPEPSNRGVPVPVGCLATGQLTLEVSDIAAVGDFSEPLYSGATGVLVDVQIGEIGEIEGVPATWVLAQVGSGASQVQVQFADHSADTAQVPGSGVVVLGHKGSPLSTLGTGALASITVFGSGGQVLASYGLGVDTSTPTVGPAPSSLPAAGSNQPSDPSAATASVTKAVETALGCTSSPLQRSQAVAGSGGSVEASTDVWNGGIVRVDRVVFTSATSSVVEYRLLASRFGSHTAGPYFADATMTGGEWLITLSSVAPGVQVTPANQVGNVTIAPGGPLFTRTWPGGTAVAVYRALPGAQGAAGYGSGDAACLPAGGIVEEITTPGAVSVITAPLFPNYSSPLIGASVSSAGTAEGAPATVVGVEAGSQVADLAVTGSAGTVEEPPVNGVAVIVLAGDPSASLGAPGSQLTVTDASGAVLETVPLQVETTPPAGPSSLPSALPSSGVGPADPQVATQAISDAFKAVFDCDAPPIDRITNIQDGSLVTGALEQLDTGPYEALASSSYVRVNQVVFESPVLADVSYTILFHSDTQLTFPMIGQAVVVDGAWRVSYSTVCAAIQLGLATCHT
jgi:hypothetical protein